MPCDNVDISKKIYVRLNGGFMKITLEQWKQMLKKSAELLQQNSSALCRIDGEIGDGDHGITIARIADLISKKIQENYDSPSTFFDDLGFSIMNIQGGSAGALWGVFFTGIGNVLSNKPDAGIADVFDGALKELQSISNAKEGDKTMMDAIIPAVKAMKAAEVDRAALRKGADAAQQGAENTTNFVAKFGRAKNYGERSLGVKDAGACSIALLFQGMQIGFNEQ